MIVKKRWAIVIKKSGVEWFLSDFDDMSYKKFAWCQQKVMLLFSKKEIVTLMLIINREEIYSKEFIYAADE